LVTMKPQPVAIGLAPQCEPSSLQVGSIMLHQVATTGTGMLVNQPRQELLAQCLDQHQLAVHMNAGGSLVAGLEFFLSPLLGALSDRFGRRPFMLLAPASGIAARLMVLFKPSALALSVERVVSDAGRAFAGTTMCYAALADLYGGGPGLVPAVASCNSASGVGMVLAPLMSSAVAWRGGGPRAVLATGAAVALFQLVIEWHWLRETRSCLEKDFKYSAVNPFGFVRLFLHGPKVRALAILLALHIAVDGKLLQDQISITQIVHAKWPLHQRSLWMSAFGGAMALGGQFTKPLLAWLGGEHAFASS